MSRYHIFDAIQAANVTVTLKGSNVAVRPSKNVTPALAEMIRTNKAELVDMLERGQDLPTCERCHGAQLAVRSFDHYENFECQQCGVCSGCRPVGNQRSQEQSARNAKTVCDSFELSRRRDNLTFSHHQELSSGGASA